MRKEAIILATALVVLIRVVSANTSPIINDLDSNILICESSDFSLEFNVADFDGDSLTVGISPSGPFYVRPISSRTPITFVELFSMNLTKLFSDKVYKHTIFVTDGKLSDTKEINITVLESNNPPVIGHTSVETIDLNKTNRFIKTINIMDQESGRPEQGRFTFTVSDRLDLLEMSIDNNGVISYEASEYHIGVHEVEVCATDSGVEGLEGKIGICATDKIESTVCRKFQLAIVNGNSPPTILAYNSSNSSSRIPSTQKLSFQIYKYDPERIYPDTYWFVDNRLKKIDVGQSADSFDYTFGCDVWGNHKIKAVISDGLQNDSVEWAFDIVRVACPEGIVSREKIGDAVCEEKWGCLDWELCQNALQSKDAGSLNTEEYEELRQRCRARDYDDSTCGYQTRICVDTNDCNSLEKKPAELTPCHFSLEPSCTDGIQNCHSGECEFLVDCGGPCKPCPTCSDRIKNQGEENIDCGGPCPQRCESAQLPEVTEEGVVIKQSMLIVTVLALIIAAIQIFRIMRNRQKLEEPSRRNLVLTYE